MPSISPHAADLTSGDSFFLFFCYVLVGLNKKGLTGTLMTALLCVLAFDGLDFAKESMTVASQLRAQFVGALAVAAIALVGSVIIPMMVKAFTRLRVSEDDETERLDITPHGERRYNL